MLAYDDDLDVDFAFDSGVFLPTTTGFRTGFWFWFLLVLVRTGFRNGWPRGVGVVLNGFVERRPRGDGFFFFFWVLIKMI